MLVKIVKCPLRSHHKTENRFPLICLHLQVLFSKGAVKFSRMTSSLKVCTLLWLLARKEILREFEVDESKKIVHSNDTKPSLSQDRLLFSAKPSF